jgi:hypothetical protein
MASDEFDPEDLLDSLDQDEHNGPGEEEDIDLPDMDNVGEATDESDPEAFSDEEGGIVPEETAEPTDPSSGNPVAPRAVPQPTGEPKASKRSVPVPPAPPAPSPDPDEPAGQNLSGIGGAVPQTPRKARLKTLFEQVVEGQPPERAKRFHELKDVMGLRDDDALWGVIAVMDIHLKLFEDIPQSITEASISATEAAKAKAIQEIQAALGRESEKMSQAVNHGIEARSTSLFIEHLTWYGAIVLLYSSFVFSVGFAAGSKAVPPWMTNGMLHGLVSAPLGPVAGSTLIASSIFLILKALADDGRTGGKAKAWRIAKAIGGMAVAGLGVWMLV